MRDERSRAAAGSTSATNGDNSIAQTFTVPSGSTTLSFRYKVTSPDTVTHDWATATLKDNTTGTTTTVLAKTSVDNYTGDATYTLFDDVAAQVDGGPLFRLGVRPFDPRSVRGEND